MCETGKSAARKSSSYSLVVPLARRGHRLTLPLGSAFKLPAPALSSGSLDDGRTYRACLTELHSELTGGGEHEGCKPPRGAGTCYYRQLERCRKEAAREGVAFALSAAKADDDRPEDSNCDVKCAGDLIRRFMQTNPEPTGQGTGNPEPAETEGVAEPADKEGN
jgi:hypothetical protein